MLKDVSKFQLICKEKNLKSLKKKKKNLLKIPLKKP